MEALIIRRPEERSGVFDSAPEKTPRIQMFEPVGSPSLIRSFGRNACFPQSSGVRAPVGTLV